MTSPKLEKSPFDISRRDFLRAARGLLLRSVLPSAIPWDDPDSRYQQEKRHFLQSHVVRAGDSGRPVINLTYDDTGYLSDINLLLDTHKNHAARSTFFLTGEFLPYLKPVVERMASEGHLIGCHGYKHDRLNTYTPGQLDADFSTWLRTFHAIVPNYPVTFFRPPYGLYNSQVVKTASEFGMQTVLWNFQTNGVTAGSDQALINFRQKFGLIVLSHLERHYDILEAGSILSSLSGQYSFETLATGLKPQDYFRPRRPPLDLNL